MLKDTSNDKYCEYGNFKRARYFHGMLMTERDFREEQNYHNEKRKMLNRMLHGWGVVCGLEIKPTNKPDTIIIRPGLALDYNGNEICVTEEYILNMSKISKLYPCIKEETSDCTEQEIVESGNKWYVIIKYEEKPSIPVAVYAPSGGCEEKACEYSRIREGYCFELKDEEEIKCCPEPSENNEKTCIDYEKKAEEPDKEYEQRIRTLFCEEFLIPCPGKCCDDKYVVLGSIELIPRCNSDSDAKFEPITQEMINNWDCRKYVMSFGLLQHWMTKLAAKLPFKSIVDYNRWAEGCIDPVEIIETYICPSSEIIEKEAKDKKEVLKKIKRKS